MSAPFHGEFASADASALTEANGRFALYGAGSTTSLTLDANDEVVITDVDVSVGATALEVRVYDGANNADGSGEVVARFNLPVNGSAFRSLASPHVCQRGTYPKVITSAAGAVDAIIHGYIRRVGS